MTFQPGQSGNPHGRPKLPPELRQRFRDMAESSMDRLQTIINDGDPNVAIRAIALVQERAFGKPLNQSRSVNAPKPADNTPAAMIAAHGELVQMASTGEIDAEDAKELSGLYETQRRMIETGEIIKRLEVLEATHGDK